jgi:hypothetical protein
MDRKADTDAFAALDFEASPVLLNWLVDPGDANRSFAKTGNWIFLPRQ